MSARKAWQMENEFKARMKEIREKKLPLCGVRVCERPTQMKIFGMFNHLLPFHLSLVIPIKKKEPAATSGDNQTRASRGLPPEFLAQLEAQFGFDKPWYERFFTMIVNYLQFDFGTSYFTDRTVIDLILDKMPVSISLGLWTTIITYLVAIPLGIRKAIREGSQFDAWTSAVLFAGYAIPNFLLLLYRSYHS